MVGLIRNFLKGESVGGVLLVLATAAAMLIANSHFAHYYHDFLHQKVIGMSLTHWINDGLMAIFFLLIGLEVKREMIEGALKTKESAIFPAIAALGGMLMPALIYAGFNYTNEITLDGWAIPAATDIAFALGIMALLGSRVPTSLKVFLLALAIIDDLGVIVIIALFYSSDLSTLALSIALLASAGLLLLNYRGVTKLSAYLLVGGILWMAVLKSGVHATLAGVLIGLAIPMRGEKHQPSPLKTLEHSLTPFVAFLILPLFALANAGISLSGISMESLSSAVPIGVGLGLFIGKPLGVFLFSWIAIKTGVAVLPAGIQMRHIFAVSILCGIGFTMSIFISSLAFGDAYLQFDTLARMGILMGSTAAAILGFIALRLSLIK